MLSQKTAKYIKIAYSDVTDGANIDGDTVVPKNHHIVVPRDDGRGLSVVTDGAIMIKGNYEIIEAKN